MKNNVLRHLPIGAEVQQDGRTHFRVWAPRRRTVEVLLESSAGIKDDLDSATYSLIQKPLSPCTRGERGWGEGARTHGKMPPHPPSTGERGAFGTDSQTYHDLVVQRS